MEDGKGQRTDSWAILLLECGDGDMSDAFQVGCIPFEGTQVPLLWACFCALSMPLFGHLCWRGVHRVGDKQTACHECAGENETCRCVDSVHDLACLFWFVGVMR
jgi:hypothetical protein